MPSDRLLLIDASSFVYRAFHGLPDLRSRAGLPTGAVTGMVNMLRRVREDFPSRYAACVFDPPGKTFRDDIFPDYKANRSAMPDDLRTQLPYIFEAVRGLGWPLVVVEGLEADDVIGTLAHQASLRGLQTLVATGDKDLAQLVSDQVTLVDTMTRDGGPPRVLDRAGVLEKFGVPPERIIDYLALVGDTVDNVPGVEKVGPKTAAKWIAEYGSLEAVMAAASAVKGVVGDNLRKALDWLPTARVLVTVKCDADLSGAVPHFESVLTPQEPSQDALRHLRDQLDLGRSLRGLLDDSPPAPAESSEIAPRPVAIQGRYETILSWEAFDQMLARLEAAELVAFDTETTSIDPRHADLVGLSFAWEVGHAVYVPVGHRYAGAPDQLPSEAVLARLRPWLEDADRLKLGQNLKYDAHVLLRAGIRLAGMAHDTLLQSYVLEAHRPHDLASLAQRHLNRSGLSYDEVTGKGAARIGFEQVAVEVATQYSGEDSDFTLHLHHTLWPQIQASPSLLRVYAEIELPSLQVLWAMEETGIRVDSGLLEHQSEELARSIRDLEIQAHDLAGEAFNLGSPKQLGEILFGKLGYKPVKKTAKGAPSTDEDVLEQLAQDYPLPKALLAWRGLSKLKSTYTDKLPRMVDPQTGRVHTTFSQAVAVTGRLASSEPNLQNIPIRTAEGRRIRQAFIAPEGCQLLSADYSQIELRIMAHLSEDPGLLTAFETGQDVHRATASEIFGVPVGEVSDDQRRYAKVINFGLIYGMSAFGLAQNLDIPREAARLYIERYFDRYPGVARYMEQTKTLAKSQGYVETVFGRRLWLDEIRSPNGPRRAAAERAAINAPMQGTAADLIKLAMVQVYARLRAEGFHARLLLQVHDELILEVPDAELAAVRELVPCVMERVAQLRVPLLVSVGTGLNWDDAH
ncbi:MAG: hypothetical protein RLY30_787 [Pseudomonadota bacterium]